MWNENESYVESKARTNKLYCSSCKARIHKGDTVVFCLDTLNQKMKEAYCAKCGKEFSYEVSCDDRHPHDLED